MIFTVVGPQKRKIETHVPRLDLLVCSRNFCYQTLIYGEIWKAAMIGATTLSLKGLHDEGLRRCL